MRILMVIDNLGSGGAQRQMVNLALGLSKRGHMVEFFVYYPKYTHFASEISTSHIPINSCKKTGRLGINVIWTLRRLIKQGNFQIVLAFMDTPNFYAEIACLFLRAKPILIVSERSVYLPGKLLWSRWLFQNCHRLADHITVNSYHQSKRMEYEFPWMKNKISTIINGVDLQRFSYSPKLLNSSDPIQLIAIGSILSNKNVLGLIKAIDIYKEKYGKSVRISWIGKQDLSKNGQRFFQEANKLIDNFVLRGSWEWLGERSDIPVLLQRCDALIHPSFYEGTSNAICEALSAGRPVLAGDISDNARQVIDGKTGFLFDPNAPDSIADAIDKFTSLNKAERRLMENRCRLFAEQSLSIDTYVCRYESLFHGLLQNKDIALASLDYPKGAGSGPDPDQYGQ